MSEEQPDPTETAYALAARELLDAVREALERMPKPLEGRPVNDTFVRAHRTIPREFVATLAGGGIDIAGGPFDRRIAEDVLQFISAFRPVRDYFQSVTDRLTYTMEKLYADVAADGLLSYHLTKRLADRRRDTGLRVSAQILKKNLGRKGRKKKEPDAEAPGPETPAE